MTGHHGIPPRPTTNSHHQSHINEWAARLWSCGALCGRHASKIGNIAENMDCAPSLKSSFELIPIILATQPKRQYWLTNRHWARLVAASDAAQDGDRIDQEATWFYGLAQQSARVKPLWLPCPTRFTPGTQKIAQLEMLMIAHALVNRANLFRRRRGFLVHWQCGQLDVLH